MIEMIEFEAGYKLENEDFELLDDGLASIMLMGTYDPSLQYQVIEMNQPIIKIYYEDDGEYDYEYVPGCCKFYKY